VTDGTANASWGRWFRLGVVAAAIAYPPALFGVVLALRYVGERWWFTGAIMYLPRLGFALPLPIIVVSLAALRLGKLLVFQVAAMLFLAFPLMGLVLPGKTRADRGPVVRIMSYNINSGLGGEGAIVEQIEKFSPDIVVLQEIGGSGDSLARRLAPRYPAIRISTQFFLGSKYPIVSAIDPDRIPLYGNMRSPRFTEQVLDTPLGKIALFNVHPISPREGLSAIRGHGLRREILSGRLLAGANAPILRANNVLRDLQLRAITARAEDEPYPVVIAGDTNLPGSSAIFRRYLSGYRDGFVDAGWGLGYTFPTNRRPWMRLDRILASEAFRFVHFEVVASTISDHDAVVSDLQAARP
jgi:vancomycin resistance protein VanJ